MALKAKITTDEYEALSDALRENYRQAGDHYVLDAEGVEDVTGLKKVLEEVKADRSKLRAEIEKLKTSFGDVKPEDARRAMEELQRLQDEKLLEAGKVDELLTKRTERMRSDHDAQVKAFQNEIANTRKENEKLTQRLEEVLIDTGLQSVGVKVGVKPTAMQDLLLRGRVIWKLHEGRPTPFRDDGSVLYGKNPNTPMSMEEWVGSLQAEAPHLFETSRGVGSEPTRAAGGNGRITLTRDQARDVRTWRNAQQEAAKTGAQVVVQD